MKSREISLPEPVNRILARLEEGGHEACVVGGCVRDSLLGRTPGDWDITTSARPEETAACFPECKAIPVGLAHGTVGLYLEGEVYEVTTYRVDGAYTDFRRPDSVAFTTSLREDLSRRDFTVNALAFHPRRGLADYFGGLADLERGRIICVGDPRLRFREDALRILRAVRFASVLAFHIGEETREAMLAERELLRHVSPERIAVELNKALVGGGAAQVFRENAPVLFQVIPELADCDGFDQRSPYHHLDVWSHSLLAMENSPPLLPVRLALLLHDIGKPACYSADGGGRGHFYGHAQRGAEMAWEILRRLRYDNATLRRVTELVLHHDAAIPPQAGGVRRWLNRLGEEALRQLLLVKRGDAAAKAPGTGETRETALREVERLVDEILVEKQCVSLKDLAVSGRDLLELGVPTGPQLGAMLNALLELVMDDKAPNRREELLEAAKELL